MASRAIGFQSFVDLQAAVVYYDLCWKNALVRRHVNWTMARADVLRLGEGYHIVVVTIAGNRAHVGRVPPHERRRKKLRPLPGSTPYYKYASEPVDRRARVWGMGRGEDQWLASCVRRYNVWVIFGDDAERDCITSSPDYEHALALAKEIEEANPKQRMRPVKVSTEITYEFIAGYGTIDERVVLPKKRTVGLGRWDWLPLERSAGWPSHS